MNVGTVLTMVGCLCAAAHGEIVTGGSATMILQEGKAASIGWLDAHFTDAVERTETLSDPAPGDAFLNRLSGTPGTIGTGSTPGVPGVPGSVELRDPVRPSGEVPSIYPGVPGTTRSRQVTTLSFDPANVLGTWAPSNDAFAFVGNTSVGEQIALTSIQRWGGPFNGVLVYGDFAVRYVPGRAGTVTPGGVLSGLVLTSNIDFLGAAWADIASATITAGPSGLNITGDLLVSGGLFVLDPIAVVGTKFGTLSLTATVPAPCRGDINGDRVVNTADLVLLLGDFGQSGPGLKGDYNNDGAVNTADLVTLLGAFGAACP